MTSPDWDRVKAVFAAAVELEGAARSAFLDTECGTDAALRAEVESLLAADGGSGPLDALGQVISRPGLIRIAGPAVGDRVGPYRLVRKLGEGGMGVVFEAEREDPELKQRVALKVVRVGWSGPDLLDRFLVERQILARLEHPNVARFLDGGVTDYDAPYLVMEYVEGTRIDDYCGQGRLALTERLTLFRAVCQAVQYAHQNLIVHRDIKPDNILVSADGVPKLLDFGIAKLVADAPFPADGHPATRTAQRRMTPEYASPEQVLGHPVTPASDAYSLGVLLYVLLTGRSPYRVDGGVPHELERAICEVEPERPSAVTPPGTEGASDRRRRRALAGDLDTITLKALRKDPDRRYATAGQLADDIGRHLAGLPVLARPDTLRYRTEKFARRHAVGLAAAALVLLSLAGGLGVALRQANIAADERDTARAEAEKSRQVSEFLAGLFEASDPGVTLGEDVSALDLLNRGAARLETGELQHQPSVRAAMLHVTGLVYSKLGQYDRALQLAEEALALRETTAGPTAVEVAESLWLLGEIQQQRGAIDTSEALFLRAASLNARALDESHPQSIAALKGLALTWQVQGKYTSADSLWRRVLELERTRFGEGSPEVAETLANLGWAWSSQGRYVEAEAAFRDALTIRLLVRGARHPEVARTRDGLASVLTQLGRFDEAEEQVRAALTSQTVVLGENHPALAHYHLVLGGLMKGRGQLDSAEAHYRTAIRLVRDATDHDDARIARSINDLAGVFSQRGDLAGADSLYREAWSLYREQVGDQHPFTALVLANVAAVARQRGDLAEAERIFRQALETMNAIWGAEHVETASLRARLGYVKMERGDYAGAEPLMESALATLERQLPPGHGRVIRTLEALVALYERWGKDEPLARYRSRLDAARATGPGD